MTCSSHNARRNAGFTLLELLVVLALMAFFAAMTISIGARSAEKAGLKRDVSLFATALRHARAEAIEAGAPVDLVIDIAEGAYDAGPAGDGKLPGGSIMEIVTAKELSSEPGRSVIRFYADGSASGGRVVISAGDERNTIAVDWLTGAVSLRRDAAK